MIENDGGRPSWLETIANEGLPSVLAGPAGKAISRLIGATADIPAAWLEGVSQDIRDRTTARSMVTRRLADVVSEDVLHNEETKQRALNSMLSRAYRAQMNKDAVARAALGYLEQTDTKAADTDEPSQDWMNKFERYAEDASGEEIQLLFGKILAGQLRRPSAVAASTLHAVSILDEEVASIILEELSNSIAVGDTAFAFRPDEVKGGELLKQATLEQVNFWTIGKTFNPELDSEGSNMVPIQSQRIIQFIGAPNTKLSLQISFLSRFARDLLSILGAEFNFERFADFAYQQNKDTLRRLCLHDYINKDGQMLISKTRTVSKPD